ncbi:hypothetical protein Dimus_029863 [Dionaea muscipula]
MEKEDNYLGASGFGNTLEFNDHNHQHQHAPPPPPPIQNQQQQQLNIGSGHHHVGESSGGGINMVDYMLNDQQQEHHHHQAANSISSNNYMLLASSGLCSSTAAASLDRLSFADVMQFADFGPRLSLNHNYATSNNIGFESSTTTDHHNNTAIDPIYFLKFPVLNDCPAAAPQGQLQDHTELAGLSSDGHEYLTDQEMTDAGEAAAAGMLMFPPAEAAANNNPVVLQQLEFLGSTSAHGNNDADNNINDHDHDDHKRATSSTNIAAVLQLKSKRKRPRSIKTTEEVESQRMTHIAVERNRRKQMNEHLRVLRSLMPTSYVQRGDQASIIGGAIEFVRELEQLLQCLESQKRRRLYGHDQGAVGGGGGGGMSIMPAAGDPSSQQHGTVVVLEDDSNNNNNNDNDNDSNPLQLLQWQAPPFLPPNYFPTGGGGVDLELDERISTNNMSTAAAAGLIREEVAECKSCIADVEVKLLGFEALIKILSRRRPGQLIRAIAALEDLQFTILHTNITTIEHTVLYSFNVKIASDQLRFRAEDIANSVQQIFTFIHANTSSSSSL